MRYEPDMDRAIRESRPQPPDPLCGREGCGLPMSQHVILPAPHDPFTSVTLCPTATFIEKKEGVGER